MGKTVTNPNYICEEINGIRDLGSAFLYSAEKRLPSSLTSEILITHLPFTLCGYEILSFTRINDHRRKCLGTQC